MKKFLIMAMMFMLAIGTDAVLAASLKVRLEISHVKNYHPHYICIYNKGCFNISNNKIVVMPIDQYDFHNIKKIALADLKNHKMYLQNFPQKCLFTVNKHVNISIKGKMSENGSRPYIDDIQCQTSKELSA